jgi:ElaA protein
MGKELVWKVNTFSELTVDELYEILHLRCKIFVVEQNTPYLDMDYKDQKALHLQGRIDGRLVAYCRLFSAGGYFDEACIGRVIVAQEYRRQGLGYELMKRAVETEETVLGETKITISAQQYLKKFYEGYGFRQVGEMYLEDGLPHIQMKKE